MQRNQDIIQRIKSELRKGIRQGLYTEGDPVPSELELAAKHGVGRALTRQALRDLESEGLLLRSRGRRSTVAPRAHWTRQPLQCTGAGIMAVAVPTYQSLYCRRILDGFNAEIGRAGYQAITYTISFDEPSETRFLAHVGNLGVSGLALWVQHESVQSAAMLEELLDRGMPLVLLDHRMEGVETDYVGTDNVLLGRMLTRSLLDRGHTRIGFLHDTYRLTSTRERAEGYRDALAGAGLAQMPEIEGAFLQDTPEMESVLAAIMARRDKPTAFYCSHDTLAVAVAGHLARLGYTIPGDIELATSDDDEFARQHGLPMMLATQPGLETGRQAAEMLLARMTNPDAPFERRLLTPEGGVVAYNL
ncbi:MAG: GntR family transcriptional regulator [Candidatus Hydrogenedens sp.]|nr:GntR family transcriptional regulator [Candidatus Hydrogenedentota bacterium]NLF58601.1 GntR family transcriptional regulator [Candidatus Hydrogenedens sp.]